MTRRTRYLKPSFFQNDVLAELGPWHRLLFAGLWVMADRAGRLEDRPRRIKAAVFPFDDNITTAEVDRMLDDLSAGDDPFIDRYQAGDFRVISVVKWAKHQNPHHREKPSELPVSPKHSVKTQSLGSASAQPQPSPVGNGEWGMGNGEWGTGNERPAPAPFQAFVNDQPTTPTPTRPPNPTEHGKCFPSDGCARGRCIPGFLGKQWLAQCEGDEDRVRAVIAKALDAVKGPLGEDPLKWWRTQWELAHKPTAVGASTGLGDWRDECERVHGGHQGDYCGNSTMHRARIQAALSAERERARSLEVIREGEALLKRAQIA